MENASEALKTAGAVSLFVIALSIIILFFNNIRQATDTIFNYKDRETEYIDGATYISKDEFYYNNTKKTRVVSLETVIPTIYRAYLENYRVSFVNLPNKCIYKIKDINNPNKIISKDFLEFKSRKDEFQNVNISDANKEKFFAGILYGDYSACSGNNDTEKKENFKKEFNIVEVYPLYEQLKNKTITEYEGIYYEDDSPEIVDINKEQARIITYSIK